MFVDTIRMHNCLTCLLLGVCGQHFCFECLEKYETLAMGTIFPGPSVTPLQKEFKLPHITMPIHRPRCSQRGSASFGTLHGHHIVTAFFDAVIAIVPGGITDKYQERLYSNLLANITPMQHPKDLARVARDLDIVVRRESEARERKSATAKFRLNPRAPAFEPRASGRRQVGSTLTQLVPFRQHTRSSHGGHERAELRKHSKPIASLIASIESAIVVLEREIAVHKQRLARLEEKRER